jgi:tRNA threonylcarbamoyladenosine biosynthesis protein TsaB
LANRDIVLAIDNSLDLLSLAVAAEGRLLEERHLRPRRHTSEMIGQEVFRVLNDHGVSVRDLTLLVVTLGPGSFTGIRVALAFCKGLKEGVGVPLIGASTLDVLAQPFSFLDGYYLCPLVDARKGEVFTALYEVSRGALTKLSSERSVKPWEVGSLVRPPCLCFGSGVALCKDALQAIPDLSCIEDSHGRVSGEVLLREGVRRMAQGKVEELKPIYGRRSEAEIKFHVTAL